MKLLFILLLLSQLTLSANSYFHPTLSSDGAHIAYYGYVGKTPDLFIIDIKNGTAQQLTDTPEFWEIEPRWLDNNTLYYLGG